MRLICRNLKQTNKACVSCQKAKVGRYNPSPAGSFPSGNRWFAYVHVNITGYQCAKLIILTNMSWSFLWFLWFLHRMKLFPWNMSQCTPQQRLLLQTGGQTYGVPKVITTDGGKQFESEIFNQLMKLLRSWRDKTTAYSKANGLVEQIHHSLK